MKSGEGGEKVPPQKIAREGCGGLGSRDGVGGAEDMFRRTLTTGNSPASCRQPRSAANATVDAVTDFDRTHADIAAGDSTRDLPIP